MDTAVHRLMTVNEVADRLAVHPKWVYRTAASDPSFPATKIGGLLRFDPARLERWIAERTQGRRRG